MVSGECRPARGRCIRAWTLLVLAVSLATTSECSPLFANMPDSFFPLGVFYQPANASGTTSFAGWKARGINTLMGWETQSNTVSIDQYSAAAVAAGMYMIREPRAKVAADATQPNLLGLLQPDEPESKGITPAQIQANYNAWTAAAPNVPVVQNFEGGAVIGWQGGVSAATYAQYIQGANILAEDIYPVTGWLLPNKLNVVGQTVDQLRSYSADANGNTKPVMAFIETSNQRLFATSHPDWNERGVTPAEFREETWDALIHGAKGIFYFSQSFDAFRYDATPIDVAAEMTKQNAVITTLTSVLNSQDRPDVTNVTLSGGLEAMSKSLNGVTYLFVLNQTNAALSGSFSAPFTYGAAGLSVLGENRTLFSGDGSGDNFTDTFGAYSYHIYAEGPAGVAPLVVTFTPEPSLVGLFGIAALFRRRSSRGRKP